MKNKLFILGCLILLHFSLKAQMKVGDNPTTINNASLLELETANKGLVFPRVLLTNVASPSPLPAGLLTGTVVYNTNAAIVNGNGTGIYVWGGSVWMSVTPNSSATAWSLTGNTGTNYTTNFIGTTDNVGFRVRTNNLQRMFIDSIGDVAIGSTAFNPNNRERLLVDYGTTTSHTVANFRGSINDYFQINIQNTSGGNKASSDYVATADDGTDTSFFVDMGINGSNYVQDPENWGNKHDAYFYSNSKNLLIGTQADSSDVYFLLGGGQIKTNAALQIKGPQGVIVVGKGDLSDAPVGNIIRGPSANITSLNLGGGDLSLAGGRATGTAKGGDLNLNGGGTLAGTGGSVIIRGGISDIGTGGSVLINTSGSTGNVRIGNSANNIFLPKFSIVGGLFYTSANTGQVNSTGANMTWDSINNRLGIGTTAPGNKLSVLGTNPLYLGGVQATSNFKTDSILTINAGVVKAAPYSSLPTGSGTGWLLVGNSDANASSFLGPTDPNIPLVFKVGGLQAGYLGISSSGITTLGVGATAGSQQSTSLGTGATATGQNSTALGAGASAGSQQSTAIGTGATASQQASLAVGYNAIVNSQNAIAIGSNANTTVTGGIALGFGATANSQNGIAIGSNAGATTNPNTLALGTGTKATGQNSIAVGNLASAPSIGSEAFGNSAAATGANSMVVGNNSTASGDGAISIGDASTAAGTNSIVLGNNSSVAAVNNSIVLGTNSSVLSNANNTILIGDGLTTSQSDALILGNTAKRIGIGTTTPAYKLTLVPQAGNDPLYVNGIQNLTTPVITDSILAIRAGVVKQIRIADLPVLTKFSATLPLTYNNSTGVFAINKATTNSDGYLSQQDWNTFNSKVGSITLSAPLYTSPLNFTVTNGAASGTLSLATQNANTVFAGPATGTVAAPSFRALVAADIPSLAGSYWSLTGNIGLNSANNFIGTTDGADFVIKTTNLQRMRILGAVNGTSNPGWISMGASTIPRSPLDISGSFQDKNVLTMQNTNSAGYTSVDMLDFNGQLAGTFGYGNPTISNATIRNKDYFFIYGNDFLIGTSGNNSGVFYIQNGGNIGINTTTPAAKVDVNGNFKLGTNGTTMTAVIDTANVTATTQASQIATNAMGTATVTVTNALLNSPVVVSPRTFPGNPFVIAYARVTAANTVTIGIYNTSGAPIALNATFKVDVVVINP